MSHSPSDLSSFEETLWSRANAAGTEALETALPL